MKYNISILYIMLLFLVLTSPVSAQNRIVFYDTIFKEAIPSIYIYNSMNEFIGATNEKGYLSISASNFPIRIEKTGYQPQSFNSKKDTCFVSIRMQDLMTVDVRPIDKLKLYHSLIKKSSEAINRQAHEINGTYFESIVLIEKNTNDTIFLDKTCDLSIMGAPKKKHIEYRYFYGNPRINIRSQVSDKSYLKRYFKDSFDLSILLPMLPDIKDLLKLNLDNVKPFKLKYEEKQITRSRSDSLEIFEFSREKKKIHLKVNALFKKGKLVRFSKPMTSDFEMILSGQKSGFPYTNTYVEFYSDKDYGVRNFHTEKVILFETFEKATKANMKLEAYIVRGFVSSRSSKKKDLMPVVKVDQIFKGLPNHPELTGFYNFIYLD